MSSLVTAILKSTVGLLCDKFRDSAADKLKDGDLSDKKLREIIVKDLTDVKSKLDCLSLKDLDSSYSFLKEGVELLNLALDKSNENQKASEGPAEEADGVVTDSKSGILKAALTLPQAIQRLNISSKDRFISAKDRFKASREAATHAFNNKSLSSKDRIMACKLRVAATILESGLEDPEAAVTTSLLSLKELHDLSTTQRMFSVFLKGGVKAMLQKNERLENITSVLSINRCLSNFAAKHRASSSKSYPVWPEIKLKNHNIHPILNAREILMNSSSGEEFKLFSRVVTDQRIRRAKRFAVNSRSEIILLSTSDYRITIIYSTGKSKDLKFPEHTESEFVKRTPLNLTVDSNDNVYVVAWFTSEENSCFMGDFVLYVFDKNGNILHVSVLDFLCLVMKRPRLCLAVDWEQNLIIATDIDNQTFVCDNTGKLKFQFEREKHLLRSMCISNNKEIVMASSYDSVFEVYTPEGVLKVTKEPPEGHHIIEVAFHPGIGKIIVITHVEKKNSWFLLSYSETGELENSSFFCKPLNSRKLYIHMKSHPNGPVAIKVEDSITFI